MMKTKFLVCSYIQKIALILIEILKIMSASVTLTKRGETFIIVLKKGTLKSKLKKNVDIVILKVL